MMYERLERKKEIGKVRERKRGIQTRSLLIISSLSLSYGRRIPSSSDGRVEGVYFVYNTHSTVVITLSSKPNLSTHTAMHYTSHSVYKYKNAKRYHCIKDKKPLCGTGHRHLTKCRDPQKLIQRYRTKISLIEYFFSTQHKTT